MDKISTSNLKMIGYKSEFMEQQSIMERFVKIITAALQHDVDRVCIENGKMLEKLFFWCFFWAAGSFLPAANMERLNKIFETIKIEFDRSQIICETKLNISERNHSVSKSVKAEKVLSYPGGYIKVTSDLESKAEFMKMVSINNTPILING